MGNCEACDNYTAPDNPHAYRNREGNATNTKKKSKQKKKSKPAQNTENTKPRKFKSRVKQKMDAGEEWTKQKLIDQTKASIESGNYKNVMTIASSAMQ